MGFPGVFVQSFCDVCFRKHLPSSSGIHFFLLGLSSFKSQRRGIVGFMQLTHGVLELTYDEFVLVVEVVN